MLARVFAGASSDFGSQQVEQDTVFVRGPNLAVLAQETGPGAFLTARSHNSLALPAWLQNLEEKFAKH